MTVLWLHRLWREGAGLLATTLAALGVAVVLAAGGDPIGQQFMVGVAGMTGIGLVLVLIVLAVGSGRVALSRVVTSDRES